MEEGLQKEELTPHDPPARSRPVRPGGRGSAVLLATARAAVLVWVTRPVQS